MTKVLLAEDDVTMLALLETLLKMEGFDVAKLRPGEMDVVSAIRRERPDVVLLDVHLQKQNGLDVMSAVRLDPELKDMRVVMTSGMNVAGECIEKGADAFLLKPYMPDDLIAVLKRAVRQ